VGFGIGGTGNAGGATAFLYLNASNFSRGLAKSAGELDAFFKKGAASAGGAPGPIAQVTSAATKVATSGLAIIGVAAKQFIEFQQAMTNAFSVMDASDAQIKETTQDVRELAVELGKSPTELADGLYEIAQAGFQASEATQILNVAGKAATAGLTTVESAAKPLIAVLNGYGLAASDATTVSDKLFVGVTQGIFTFEELASQIGDNVPLAHALGVSLDDLITSYIVLTKQGNSLSESTTQLNGVMNALLKPSDKLIGLLHQMGFESGEDILKQKGLIGTVRALQQEFGLTNDQLAELFPNIRGLRGEIGLLNVSEADLLDTQEQVANSAGKTEEVFKKQTQTVAFQLKVVREQVRGAAIDLGAGFAPVLAKVATEVGKAAQAFSNLSPAIRGTVSSVVLGVTGIASLLVVVVKVTSSFIEAARAVKAFTFAMQISKWEAAASILGLIAIAIGVLVERHMRSARAAQEHEDKVKALNEEYIKLGDIVSGLRLDKLFKEANAVAGTMAQIQGTQASQNKVFADGVAQIAKYQEQLREFGTISPVTGELEIFPGLPADSLAKARNIQNELKNLQNTVYGLGDADGVATAATGLLTKAAQDQRVDIIKVAEGIDALLTSYKAHLITGPQIIDMFAQMGGTLENYALDTTEATEAEQAKKLADEALAKQQADLQTSTDELIASTLDEIRGFKDLVPWMSGVQSGLTRIGDTAAKVANRMARQKLGGILDPEDMKPGIFSALQLLRAQEKAYAQLTKTDDAISQNADDISMWSGRIDTVTDLLGFNTDTLTEWRRELDAGEINQQQFNAAVEAGFRVEGALPKLDRLREQGRITREQYNDAVEAGIYLTERSVGGILDEEAATAKLLPDLAKYVELADKRNQDIKDATPQQRQFIAMMKTEGAQTAINTLQQLSYLAAIGAIPKEKVTKFIADTAALDPAMEQLFKDLGLIDEKGHVVKFDVDETDLTDAINRLNTSILTLPTLFGYPDMSDIEKAREDAKKKPVIIPSQIEPPKGSGQTSGPGGQGGNVAPPPSDTTPAPVQQIPPVIATTVKVTLSAEDTAALDHLYGQVTNWVDFVTTTFVFNGGGEIKEVNDLDIKLGNWDENNATVDTTFNFTTDTEFTTTFDSLTTEGHAAQANLDILVGTLRESFVAIATDASNLGLAAGSGFKTNFTSGVDGASVVMNAEAGEIRGQASFDLFNEGFNTGLSYGVGLSAGLYSQLGAVQTAAAALTAAAHSAAQQEISVHSPSRASFYTGEMFGEGLIQGMASRERELALQSASLGNAMKSGLYGTLGLVGGAGATATINSVVSGGARPQLVVQQHNYALSASDMQKLLGEATTGADFARSLTHELDVRRG